MTTFQKLSDQAEIYYWRSKREYHNYGHAKNVAAVVKTLKQNPSDALVLAALWHDAVYFPQAKESANEYASAAALNYEFQQLRKDGVTKPEDEKMVSDACYMIERTRVSVHLIPIELWDCQPGEKKEELAILLDADLSSLASPYHDFVLNQRNIILENYAEVNAASHIVSANFLSGLASARQKIFHTKAGRSYFEELAQSNIKRYRDECVSGEIMFF